MTLSARPAIERAKVVCVIPVRNGGDRWCQAAAALEQFCPSHWAIWVIDSSSTDHSMQPVQAYGWSSVRIEPHDFDHGATRNLALEHCHEADYLVFLTQDAILSDAQALLELISAFDDPLVGLAYGRQLPHADASVLAQHLRHFNYPEKSRVWDESAIRRLGMRAVFNSNSFAAYRVAALRQIGGFPEQIILAEDMIAAWCILRKHWRLAYVASACVYHSHNYSWSQEFARYFDVGVMHDEWPRLLTECGTAQGEGWRYVAHLFRHLWQGHRSLLIGATALVILKYLAYRLGRWHWYLPRRLCQCLSSQKNYWQAAPSLVSRVS